MKKLCLAWIGLCFSGFTFANTESSQGFNPDEITYVVTMSANDKSVAEIDSFSSFYHKLVEGNEPPTLAWQFYRGSDEKIYLIERYENSKAALQHVINISPGGIQEKEFGDFTDHFAIEKITIHGTPSEELIESLRAVGLPLEFRALISGYSRK
jgi:hypothetical protein